MTHGQGVHDVADWPKCRLHRSEGMLKMLAIFNIQAEFLLHFSKSAQKTKRADLFMDDFCSRI
jgi:hypothetical protein